MLALWMEQQLEFSPLQLAVGLARYVAHLLFEKMCDAFWLAENDLLNSWREMSELHDLRDAGARDAELSGDLSIVGEFAVPHIAMNLVSKDKRLRKWGD